MQGILEDEIRIGDRLRIGSAEFEVRQPRMPCFKLGIRFGRDDMIKRFLESGRSGLYLGVLQEGTLERGAAIALVPSVGHDVTIADVAQADATGGDDEHLLRRIVAVPTLPGALRQHCARLWER